MRLAKSIILKLNQHGLRAIPSRVRDPGDIRYGGYMVIDIETNTVIEGGYPLPFSLSAADVRDLVDEISP